MYLVAGSSKSSSIYCAELGMPSSFIMTGTGTLYACVDPCLPMRLHVHDTYQIPTRTQEFLRTQEKIQ